MICIILMDSIEYRCLVIICKLCVRGSMFFIITLVNSFLVYILIKFELKCSKYNKMCTQICVHAYTALQPNFCMTCLLISN